MQLLDSNFKLLFNFLDHQATRTRQLTHLLFEEVYAHELKGCTLILTHLAWFSSIRLTIFELHLKNVLLHVLKKDFTLVIDTILESFEFLKELAEFALLTALNYCDFRHVPLLWLL